MMMVLVITLLKLFVVKWVLLMEVGAGEVDISGVRSKLLLILHLSTTFIVVAEIGAHVPTTSETIAVITKMFFLSAMGLVSKCLYLPEFNFMIKGNTNYGTQLCIIQSNLAITRVEGGRILRRKTAL